MKIGLIGLLGVLQISCSTRQETLQDSIMALMESVAPAVYSQGTSGPLYILRAQNQTEIDIFDCKFLARGEEERTSVAVSLCERSSEREKRTATIISSRHDSAGIAREKIVIDLGRDYSADVCYQNSINVEDRTINVRFLNLEGECQSLYYESLKKFEEYKPVWPRRDLNPRHLD